MDYHIPVKLRYMQQCTLNLFVTCILCADPRHDDNVKAAVIQLFMQPVTLPDQSGNTMSDNTVPYFFAN